METKTSERDIRGQHYSIKLACAWGAALLLASGNDSHGHIHPQRIRTHIGELTRSDRQGSERKGGRGQQSDMADRKQTCRQRSFLSLRRS